MGKTRDLFKKIRDIKGTFHAKMGLINDRNGMELTEAEDIKKKWQEYTEKIYKQLMQLFPFFLCLSHPFFSQLFVRPPQTNILPFCISFSWEWF